MQIASYETFAVAIAGYDYHDADGLSLDDLDRYGYEGDNHILIPWEHLPGLINALQYAQRQREAAVADGTVAAILLQDHNAAAPGDLG